MSARDPVESDRLRRMVEVALPMARAHAELLGEIRAALEQGDDRLVLTLARRLCGLPPVERTP